MSDSRPIGIFDSGFGGISVLKAAVSMLPSENFIYFGDNAYAPYGLKAAEQITERALVCASFLVQKGCKAIVVACNTATSAAINKTREVFNVPVVSIEPAIKPALEQCPSGNILMIATPATCSLSRYLALKDRLGGSRRVIDVGGYGIVEMLEQGLFAPGAYQQQLGEILAPYEGLEVGGIVLGCTHYLFIKDEIASYARQHFTGACRIFDGNRATALQLGRVLAAAGLEFAGPGGEIAFFTSGSREAAMPIFRKLMDTPLEI